MQPVHPRPSFPTAIPSLGPCRFDSPVAPRWSVGDDERVLYDLDLARLRECLAAGDEPVTFERAGPRRRIFFDPPGTTAALVTCGGLCPGLNDVVRAIVHELRYVYGVGRILGIRYGYAGLNPAAAPPPIELDPPDVSHVHEEGGTFLGSSRGPQPTDVMVDTLVREKVDILFTIGGDGTLRGARAILDEISRRGLNIAVVGVPKTIDNDIALVSRTFGFESAVEQARNAIRCLNTEVEGIQNGIGIVKLMGRHSGFIAANAALASGDVNYVLIPEVPFALDGPEGLLAILEERMRRRGHAVVVVAEGAGQQHFGFQGTDASGNVRLGDIGVLLGDRIRDHFAGANIPIKLTYIDPSYIVRSVPASADDSVFCVFLGQNAVHAAMAGKTGLLVASWNNVFVNIPLEAVTSERRKVDPAGPLWRAVLEATGQPPKMGAEIP